VNNMTWLQRYRVRAFLQTSVWLPPVVAIGAGLAANRVAASADPLFGMRPTGSVAGSQAVLAALASAMLTFIVFVFSILLLAVQLASAQLTPRVIAFFYRSWTLRLSLSVFVLVFTFDLAVLSRIDSAVPRLSGALAAYGTIGAIALFLYMIDKVGKGLRPISVLTGVARIGLDVIAAVYPHERSAALRAVSPPPPVAPEGDPPRIVENVRRGVVLAFDPAGIAALAGRAGSVVEMVPQVGDFVAKGDPLFRVYGGRIDERDLQQSIAIGPERTLEQDPTFAFRIIVDVAAKALSPAINDPTTGVLALDQLHHLLRSVSRRDLATGQVRDETGTLRLQYRTPDWDDFVHLAVVEIRHYGRDSIQIARRLRAMLEHLIAVVPPDRAAALQGELELLGRTVDRTFADAEDRTTADSGDSLGMGGAPPGVATRPS
jgi:uncharacterized membrane protein